MRRSMFAPMIFLFLAFSCLHAGSVFAVEDGFTVGHKVSCEYFTIFVEPGIEVPELNERLNIGFSDSLLAGRTGKESPLPGDALAEMVDILFLRVTDILDMRLFDFKGNIKICRNSASLGSAYQKIFGRDMKDTCSFYVNDLNTIYITADHFEVGVLGHEIAHTVQSHYFVVAAPTKVQEVLAGYVEFQLRKKK